MKSSVKKLLYIIAVFIVCVPMFFVVHSLKEDVLPYKEHHIASIHYKIVRPDDINRTTIKSEIDDLFDSPKYILIHTELQSPWWGLADIKGNRIYIEDSLNFENYCFVLAHEIVHIKYNTDCERRTNIIAWKTLFFSGNDYFKNIALQYAHKDLQGCVDYDYSILGYIEQYIMEDQCR